MGPGGAGGKGNGGGPADASAVGGCAGGTWLASVEGGFDAGGAARAARGGASEGGSAAALAVAAGWAATAAGEDATTAGVGASARAGGAAGPVGVAVVGGASACGASAGEGGLAARAGGAVGEGGAASASWGEVLSGDRSPTPRGASVPEAVARELDARLGVVGGVLASQVDAAPPSRAAAARLKALSFAPARAPDAIVMGAAGGGGGGAGGGPPSGGVGSKRGPRPRAMAARRSGLGFSRRRASSPARRSAGASLPGEPRRGGSLGGFTGHLRRLANAGSARPPRGARRRDASGRF